MPDSKSFDSPGQAIKHFLDEKDWTQEDLSYILSLSLKHVNELIKDKKPLSIDIAKLLENVFEMEAYQWMKLAAKSQLKDLETNEKETDVKLRAGLFRYMPINELIKKGWLNGERDLVREVKNFWRLDKNEKLDLSFLDKKLSRIVRLKYRRSDAYQEPSEYNTLIWHQMADNFARKQKGKPFSRKGLNQLMHEMPSYTTTSDTGIKKFLSELADIGVKFVYLSHLSKTYLDGAAFLSEDEPVVCLTGRYDRIDNFWFTLAHELGHVALHLSSDTEKIFTDDTTKKSSTNSLIEQEANREAEKALLQDTIMTFFEPFKSYITEDKVLEFCQAYRIHPSIVVGNLAFNEVISYSTSHRFRETVRDKIPSKYRAG